jgi:hypothetical protein
MTTEPSNLQREIRQINAYSDELQQNARSQLQSIPARCHNFLDENGQREGRLVVLLDSQGRAMEAELAYDRRLPEVTQSKLQRLAKKLLATSYASSGPDIPLYIYDLGSQFDRDNVANRYADDGGQSSINVLYVAVGIVALFFVVGILFAMLNVIFRNRQEAAAPTATPPALLATLNDAAAAATPGATATIDPAAFTIQTNNLPPSRNANPGISVNGTVRIRDQLKSFVRSQPGSDQGEALGFMQDGETAIVLGGPVMLQGDTDTIVWWYVELTDGTRGWTPANTSTLSLLEPVQ